MIRFQAEIKRKFPPLSRCAYLSLVLVQIILVSPQPTPLEWLLLRIIDAVPAWRNIYRLTRFFAKTDVCLSFYKDLAGLVEKDWLSVKDQKAQVKEYDMTIEGQRLLAEGYRTLNIKDYVMTIEPTGFILGLLEKIDENLSEKSGS